MDIFKMCSSGLSLGPTSPYTQLLLVQSYLNLISPIIYMHMIYKFTWNLTEGILILVSLNWKIALRLCKHGWAINNLTLNHDKTKFI